jgi:hypothetical protein
MSRRSIGEGLKAAIIAGRLAEACMPPVETEPQINGTAAGTPPHGARSAFATIRRRNAQVNQDKDKVPPPVLSNEPEEELENKLERHPDDQDAKVDVGSDESMDASDPPASSQPGCADEPVPSSGFPEDD